jgi:glutamyl-tRNA reductase
MHAYDGLQQLGTAHDHADLATRERLAPVLRALVIAARTLGVPHVELATCHRHELYWIGDLPLDSVLEDLAEGSLQLRSGETAVTHLLAVASGRVSVVLGETEILGQVRRAWHAAQEVLASNGALDGLFEQVVAGARRVRRAAAFEATADSAAASGVRLAFQHAAVRPRRVVLIGAGEAARTAAMAVRAQAPWARMMVVARQAERAEVLAADVTGEAHAWSELVELVGQADLVIAATGARSPILLASHLRARRPGLVLLDLGVPRNIEPVARSFSGLVLLDLDDLARHEAGAPSDVDRTAACDAALAHEMGRVRRAHGERDLPIVLRVMHSRGDAVADNAAAALCDRLGLAGIAEREAVHEAMRHAVRQALFPASRALRGEALPDG